MTHSLWAIMIKKCPYPYNLLIFMLLNNFLFDMDY